MKSVWFVNCSFVIPFDASIRIIMFAWHGKGSVVVEGGPVQPVVGDILVAAPVVLTVSNELDAADDDDIKCDEEPVAGGNV